MKQKLMKRILSLALSSALVFSCATPMMATESQNDIQTEAVTDQKGAVGVSKDELDRSTTVLTLDVASKGVLMTEEESDYFKFTIKEQGYFNLKFGIDSSAITDNIQWGWNIEIYQESDLVTPIKSVEGVTKNYEFAKLPMGPGNYYVKVYANHTWYAPVGCGYTVMADFTASNVWETEGNDEQAKSNAIEANTIYYGNFYHAKDVDWYKVQVTNTGYIRLVFNIGSDTVSDKIGWGWDVHIYNSNSEEIKVYEGITKNFTAQILPFSKGTYYIKVCPNHTWYAPEDCTYELNLNSEKNSYWESEKNEEKATADTIEVNKTYSAMLYHAEDVDWYTVKTDKAGYFKLQFNVDGSVNKDDISWGWKVTIYDKNLNEVITYEDITTSMISDVIPYEKGIYYIKVSADHSWYAPVDCIYNLQVAQTATSTWESEVNNTRAKADTISLDKTYKGNFLYANDEDWFKFTTKANGTVKLTLKLADADGADAVGWGWNVYIYKKSGSTAVKELVGVKDKGSVTVDLAKGTYYVKVIANHSWYSPVKCTYGLTVNYSKAPGKVTISSITAGKKQATLKWKKTKDADGYIVYRSTSKNGTYKKVKTITKASTVKYTDKKLKSGKKYYYKVVAYNKTKGVTANAAASKIKSVKTN